MAGLFRVWRASSRLPHWSLQVDVAVGNLLVSVVAGAGLSQQLRLANLYFLVALFALSYFPLTSALAHIATAGLPMPAFWPSVPGSRILWWRGWRSSAS